MDTNRRETHAATITRMSDAEYAKLAAVWEQRITAYEARQAAADRELKWRRKEGGKLFRGN